MSSWKGSVGRNSHVSKPEKRMEERIVYEYTIVFRSEKSIMETVLDISNISRSGAYVATNHPLDIGTKCSVEIKLRGPKDNPVVVLAEGVIVRVDNKGQGIEFTHLDEDTLVSLDKILSSRET